MENNNKKPNRISYDDILANMGLYVENGALHKGNKQAQANPVTNNKSVESSTIRTDNIPIKQKMSKEEYINLWLKQRIQQKQNQNMKSTKLIMPIDNIHVRKLQSHDVLFKFSSPQHSINLKGNPNI
jgi:hypothetical protein